MNKLWKQLDNNILSVLTGLIIAFIALYPKLPSIQVTHTWVYIRLEDFLILLTVFIWIVQVVRKKVSFPKPEGNALIGYWIIGCISLIYSLVFIGPHLANFFDKIAILEYIRRIEYMMLFFIGFSAVRNKKDIHKFITILFATVSMIILYGFGQKFYLFFWHVFPKFFEKNPFCFPAFLTGNEEFAKGVPFCLSETSRITSTFGGHYDLAAYLVFVIPILVAIFIVIKKWYLKILTACVGILSIVLLNFTSSRTSFAAYIIGIIAMLVIWKKKLWIIPVLIVSFSILLAFSSSTLQRFAKTVQPVQVVTINTASLPSNLQNIIKKTKESEENKSLESPPPGTITIGSTPQTPTAPVTTVLTTTELKKIKVDLNKVEISTLSGNFLISKAYALDISFTTRFQAEWPRDIIAFQKYPLLGQGYSTLTLASDNDYLRLLGETGIFGALSFLLIFVILGIYMRSVIGSVTDITIKAYAFGLVGGVIGLLVNAVLIDVFEASKVAESLWVLVGIGVGSLAFYQKKKINYSKALRSFFTSPALIGVYLLFIVAAVFSQSISNFFVGDDFTWIHWAASGMPSDIRSYFLNASGFFYRPITKTVMYVLYQFFSFTPQGYHIVNLFLHFLVSFGVYLVALKILRNKFFSAIAGIFFVLLPSSFENLYWISTLSTNLCAVGIIYSIWSLLKFRETKQWIFYIVSLVLSFFAVLSYEGGVITPLLLFAIDLWFVKEKILKKRLISYVPYLLVTAAYFMLRRDSHAIVANGDYAYNLPHLLPNFIGNLAGYIGLFIFGQHMLPFYTLLRTESRRYSIIVGLVIVGGFVFLLIRLFNDKKLLSKIANQEFLRATTGFVAILIIGLLPFLGLGNISPRYSYIGGIGFVLLIAYLLQQIKLTWEKDSGKYAVYAVASISVILMLSTYIISLRQENTEWVKAGDITSLTLRYFRADNDTLPSGSVIYINNIPIRYANAWVFPVGLSDGLWFIYRDPMMKVINVSSITAAQSLKAKSAVPAYIFTFDKNYVVGEVQ